MLPPLTLHRHPHDITAVDVEYQYHGHCASHIIVQDGRALIVDVGPNDGVPRVLAALRELGLGPEAVDYVFLTHVHLDHAGGVGLLMQNLPAATAIVHPRGARHMIDPSALVAGATAVYGEEEMARSYGSIVGVPAQRVRESADGMSIDLAGRLLRFLDTPGHARHHHCIWDTRTRGFFTGDTFGLSYREFDTDKGPWLLPTTTPVQFEPDKLRESVQRLLAYQPECMYLTHYSRVRDVQRLGASLLEQLARLVAIGRGLKNAPDRHEALKRALLAEYVAITAAHGCRFSEAELTRLLGVDLELNAQGMGVWLDKEA